MEHTLTRSSVHTLLSGLDGVRRVDWGDGEQRHCKRFCVKRAEVVGMGKSKRRGNNSPYIPWGKRDDSS